MKLYLCSRHETCPPRSRSGCPHATPHPHDDQCDRAYCPLRDIKPTVCHPITKSETDLFYTNNRLRLAQEAIDELTEKLKEIFKQ